MQNISFSTSDHKQYSELIHLIINPFCRVFGRPLIQSITGHMFASAIRRIDHLFKIQTNNHSTPLQSTMFSTIIDKILGLLLSLKRLIQLFPLHWFFMLDYISIEMKVVGIHIFGFGRKRQWFMYSVKLIRIECRKERLSNPFSNGIANWYSSCVHIHNMTQNKREAKDDNALQFQ